MKKQSLSRSAAEYVSVRLGLALLLAVPLAVAPSQNEVPAQAVIPDSVAFSQAGVTAAPTEWANRILVEDFNAPGDTTEQMISGSGIDSPVGTFRGTGSSYILYEDQFGGAPCHDCGTRTTTYTTISTTNAVPAATLISNFPYVSPFFDPNSNDAQFDRDISVGSPYFLGEVISIYFPDVWTENVAETAYALTMTATNPDTGTSDIYTASIVDYDNLPDDRLSKVDVQWDDVNYSTVQLNIGNQINLDFSYMFTYTTTDIVPVTEITPGVDGRMNKFPAVGNGSITLTLASSTNYRYVGFWWSAGSPYNKICLLPETGSTCIAEYNTENLMANASFTKEGVSAPYWRNGRPHYGNPRARTGTSVCSAIDGSTNHCDEPFAFIHIFQDSGFRRVMFSGDGRTGFEFDNVTVSTAESWELIDMLPAGTLLGASTLPAYSVSSPSVIPVDPRSDSVSFPGVLLGGPAANQPDASLCVTEVDASGTPVAEDPSNLQISATVPAGVNSESSGPRFAYSGARETIRDLSATIRINSANNSENVTSSVSKYLRFSVEARTGTGLTTCSGSNNVITAVIVELRPIRLNGSYIFGIPID
jgi:hypothetical protein